MGSLPERGDVVVFKLPSDNKTDYIKRVVGLPGDRIQVRDGLLYINDVAVKIAPAGDFDEDDDGRTSPVPMLIEQLPSGREHLILDRSSTGSLDNTGIYVVPPDHVFAMGDNRDNSLDSRVQNVGFIPVQNLIGRAELLFFSVNGEARFWQPWTWPLGIRYGRLLNIIQ
jgi:signal peptidase I